MMSRIGKAAFLGSVTLVSIFGTAHAASKSGAVNIPDPAPGYVLADVWGEKGDGSASYALANANGSSDIVSLWYNYHFEIAGTPYYTGFTVLEPGEGSSEEGLLFGQATYRLDTDGGKSFWTLFHGQNDVGELPGVTKAEQVDDTRDPVQYVTSNQHVVLAVPTTIFEAGETINNFTIFSFDPEKNDRGDYKGWAYLGSVAAGGENSANCGDDLPTPCVSSTGKLSFVSPVSGTMPVIRVDMSGTQVEGPGKTRTLGANDAVDYTFDENTRQYQQPAGN
ncbi:hypothetical protein [Shinella oryzae]|uniref:Uncharacterized protein n=1 Tax=Shinella oryzae TaxID=2871820 RepID=A0ABY9KBZ3_9HYPH|nr:hypothetical protein [Shinella oryzae]WLS05134.1 hypothetical protein Q9315_23515 [Shinella oryzae]